MSKFKFFSLTLMAASAAVALMVAAPQPSKAHSGQSGPTINLGSIQPANPGWGQKAQFSVYIAQNGHPIKGAFVTYWFSGRHGIKTTSGGGYTNAEGRLSFLATIPSNWRNQQTWVDLNASCTKVGVLNLWRVKNK